MPEAVAGAAADAAEADAARPIATAAQPAAAAEPIMIPTTATLEMPPDDDVLTLLGGGELCEVEPGGGGTLG
jgi:hypothetical protein